jgi:hypothetical protein
MAAMAECNNKVFIYLFQLSLLLICVRLESIVVCGKQDFIRLYLMERLDFTATFYLFILFLHFTEGLDNNLVMPDYFNEGTKLDLRF